MPKDDVKTTSPMLSTLSSGNAASGSHDAGSIGQYVGTGRVASVSGEAYLIHPGDSSGTPVHVGMEVHVGDVIASRNDRPANVTFEGDKNSLTVTVENNAMVVGHGEQHEHMPNTIGIFGGPSVPTTTTSEILSSFVPLPPTAPGTEISTVMVAMPAPGPSIPTSIATSVKPTIEHTQVEFIPDFHPQPPHEIPTATAVAVKFPPVILEAMPSFFHPYDGLVPGLVSEIKYVDAALVRPAMQMDAIMHQEAMIKDFARPTDLFGGEYTTRPIYADMKPVDYVPAVTKVDSVPHNPVPAPEEKFSFSFVNSDSYNTPAFKEAGVGIREFATNSPVIGSFVAEHAIGAVNYTFKVEGNTIIPSSKGDGAWETGALSEKDFSLDAKTGALSISNPLALVHFANKDGILLNVTGTDEKGNIFEDKINVRIQDFLSGVKPLVSDIGGTQTGSDKADFLVNYGHDSKGGTGNISGHGGADVLIAGPGNNTIVVGDASFRYVDGGANAGAHDTNILVLGFRNDKTGFSLDLTNAEKFQGVINNINRIDLGRSDDNTSSSLTLNIKNIFDLNSDHLLYVSRSPETKDNVLNLDTTGLAVKDTGDHGTTYTGKYNGVEVTLIVDNTIHITDTAHK